MCCYICRINKKNWYDSINFRDIRDASIRCTHTRVVERKWKRYMYLFIAICIGSGAVLYLENRSGLEIFDRFSKLSTDGGSGRDVIWAITLQAFNVSNLREKFGDMVFKVFIIVLDQADFLAFHIIVT